MTHLSNELLKVWFIFSFSLGCWTCFNLLISKRGDKRIKYSILGFIILLLVPPLNAYINLANNEPIGWLLILSQKLTWCYGPILVALIKHILLRPFSRSIYAVQFIPFVLAATHEIVNLGLISFPLMVTLLFIQVFSYLSYAAWLLFSERTRLLKLTQQFKNTSYYWLIFLVSSLFLIMLVDLWVFTLALGGQRPPLTALAVVAGLIAIFVNAIALFSLYQPEVFFHEITQEDEKEELQQPNLRSIELSAEAARQLDEQLMALVKSHKPHLDETISLQKLASLLGVTSHQLSELLNIHKSTSFYDFLNELRYQESINFLKDYEQDLTISDIAYRSGFNNRNSFYKVFKQKTGLTPLQYKKSNSQ